MLPEGFLFKILDVMKVGLMYVNEDQKIVYLNNEASKTLNEDAGSMFGNSILNCHSPEIHPAVLSKITELGKHSGGEWHKVVERNGRYLENYYSSVFDEGKYKGIVIATRDITERERMAKTLRKYLEEITVLFEAARLVNSSLNIKQVLDGIVSLAQNVLGLGAGGILVFDRATREILYEATYNYSPDELAKLKSCRPFTDLIRGLDDEYSVQPAEDQLACSLTSKAELAVPMVINSDINVIWFVENRQDESFSSERQKMLVTLVSLTSSAIKNAWMYERTMVNATTDQLTGLYNRQYFNHVLELEKEKARVLKFPLSLIMVDLNRLKFINDNFGHEKGDYVIREAAMILKQSVRKGELVFRYGGDEMVILLPDSDRTEAAQVAKRIQANAEKWNQDHRESQVFVHLSIGCATAADAETMENLVAAADEDMYRDKQQYYESQGLVRNSLGPR